MAVIALSILPGMTVPTPAAIMLAEFHQSYWVADGVAIGRVVGEQGPTIEIQVEEWIRDRTEQHQGQIRSLPYSEPSCLPGSGRADSYSSDARYLFFIRQPYDSGSVRTPYWSIIERYRLDGSPLCVSPPPMFRVGRPNDHCKPNLRETDLLDAVRTFEDYFELNDPRIVGTYWIKEIYSEPQLKEWRRRSVLHEILAGEAVRGMDAK